ncbi:MAG TPA: capsular biosynthesis protein, partial [Gammaproteobacteria bacterium]|nr:capsular biosynthesis protein [Gammaproteobacteria bacterium]
MKSVLKLLTARNLRIGLIALPWLVAAVYLTIFAEDRYVAESVVAVKQNSEGMAGVDTLTSLFGTSGASSREDEHMLEAHILSLDMLRQLDEHIDLRSKYAEPWKDPVFRLSPNASQEAFLGYYRDRTEVLVDDNAGLITIR